MLADGKLRLDFPLEHVARLTIDNPDRRNALDQALLDGFATVVPELECRCLIITGVGSVFSAGYDLIGLPADELPERAEALIAHPFQQALIALENFPYPIVGALNGHAIGGGLELALTCDLRIASESATFGMPPAKLGLVYSHTGIRKFLAAVGVARTNELFLLGRNISAATANGWGLVNEVLPNGDVANQALTLAQEIAANAPLALTGNKRVIQTLTNLPIDTETERHLVELRRACFQSHDFREGVRAFAEKRAPEWNGR